MLSQRPGPTNCRGGAGQNTNGSRAQVGFTSGWRGRAEIEVVLLLQLTDDGRQVDKFDLRRPHFRLDLIQLPCPTLRAAVWTHPYGLSVPQAGQPLQFEEQLFLDL